ncbi:MAG: hypothetical protein PHH77_07845 [Victivallaceae bacterium]|nr:hypothetical protein [Victivallaceae bacterium]
MANKIRTIRITVGIILIIILIVSVIPNFYLYTSNDGIISARTTTLTSPVEGILSFTRSVQHGEYFKKGELIGKVVNDRVDLSFLHKLITEQKTLEGRITSFTERIERYVRLKAELRANIERFQKFSATQLHSRIKQDENRLGHEKAEYERARKELIANRYLEARKAVKTRELESSEANYNKASQRIREITEHLAELRNTLEAVQAGTFLGEGNNDSPYSKQRLDQMVIELSLARTTLQEAASRLEGIKLQLKTERERIEKVRTFRIKAPFDALAWRLPMAQGSTVVIGSELIVLLDCSSIFLDIVLSESQFANIKPGMKIKYRLIGGLKFFEGTVIALRGSGTDLEDRCLATELKKDSRKEFRIWVAVNPADLELSPKNFFQVGRRVEIRMPRKWSVTRELIRFWHVF